MYPREYHDVGNTKCRELINGNIDGAVLHSNFSTQHVLNACQRKCSDFTVTKRRLTEHVLLINYFPTLLIAAGHRYLMYSVHPPSNPLPNSTQMLPRLPWKRPRPAPIVCVAAQSFHGICCRQAVLVFI